MSVGIDFEIDEKKEKNGNREDDEETVFNHFFFICFFYLKINFGQVCLFEIKKKEMKQKKDYFFFNFVLNQQVHHL